MWEDSILEGTYLGWLPDEILCVIFDDLMPCDKCHRYITRLLYWKLCFGLCDPCFNRMFRKVIRGL